ncbi:MAG: DUF3592 domain-containing protein [Planctomycetales bacterium]|nr:DUF3592 domain-containing protein [Planctomycetales bacterium]
MAGQRGAGLCGSIVLMFVGAGFLSVSYFLLYLPERRGLVAYVETTATVLDGRIGESRGGSGNNRTPTYRPEIHIQYTVAGKQYDTWTYDMAGIYSSDRESKQTILDQFHPGKQVACWYDPENPGAAILVRGHSWLTWIFLGIGALIFLLGSAGLLWYLVLGGIIVALAMQSRKNRDPS